jgi:transposase-like protein
MRKNQSIRRNGSQWQKIIKDQKESRQSASAYCHEKGLSEKSFYAWRRRLPERSSASVKEFVEVTSTDRNQSKALRITTPSGYCVEVSVGTESDFVKEVLEALK